MLPPESRNIYPVQKLENEIESYHPSLLGRCAKFISRIFQSISLKKPEELPSTPPEGKPRPGSCGSDCHRPVSPKVFTTPSPDESQGSTDYTPDDLQKLLSQNLSDCIEHLHVASARRCKTNARNGREFIIFEVVDNRDSSRLRSLLTLDQRLPGDNLIGLPRASHVYFRVSNGGSEQALAQCCGYDHYKILETMSFDPPSNLFPVYNVVTLAGAVISANKNHDQTSSRWFTAYAWSSIKEIQSTALRRNHYKRPSIFCPGRKGIYKTTSPSPPEVSRIVLEVKRNELAIRESMNQEKRLDIEEVKRDIAFLHTKLQDMP